MTAPALEPTMTSIGMLCSASCCSTPTWLAPRRPPPLSTSPMRAPSTSIHFGASTPASQPEPCASETKTKLYDELIGRVQRLIKAELLLSRDAVDRKRRRLVIHRRGADVPVDVLGFHRPVRGHPVFRTRA